MNNLATGDIIGRVPKLDAVKAKAAMSPMTWLLPRRNLRSACPLFRFKTEADFIEQANYTEFGLASYFYVKAARIEFGVCHINGPTTSDSAQMPIGGVKGSG